MPVQKTREFWCDDTRGDRVLVIEYTEMTKSTATPGMRSLKTAQGELVNALGNDSFQIVDSGMILRQTDD